MVIVRYIGFKDSPLKKHRIDVNSSQGEVEKFRKHFLQEFQPARVLSTENCDEETVVLICHILKERLDFDVKGYNIEARAEKQNPEEAIYIFSDRLGLLRPEEENKTLIDLVLKEWDAGRIGFYWVIYK